MPQQETQESPLNMTAGEIQRQTSIDSSPQNVTRYASTWSHLVLRPSEQGWIACLLAAGLVSVIAWAVWGSGDPAGRIEIEQATPLNFQFQVDLNAAKSFELESVPGIGPRLAERIVEFRSQQGHFTSFDQLLDVPGVGPATVDKIKPYLKPLDRD